MSVHVLNPKSITADQLFGYMTPTLEWIDGVLPRIVRSAVGIPDEAAPAQDTASVNTTWHWIVFDGPVDSLWIESLNSVLDDSKTLCLPNGERIVIPPYLR